MSFRARGRGTGANFGAPGGRGGGSFGGRGGGKNVGTIVRLSTDKPQAVVDSSRETMDLLTPF
jgi:hypothetical protein